MFQLSGFYCTSCTTASTSGSSSGRRNDPSASNPRDLRTHMAMGQYPVLSRGPPPLCYQPLSRRLCFKPLSRGIAGAPPILLTGMLRNSKQADTLRFHEGECAKYRKKMRVQQAVNPEASIVQERGLGFKV